MTGGGAGTLKAASRQGLVLLMTEGSVGKLKAASRWGLVLFFEFGNNRGGGSVAGNWLSPECGVCRDSDSGVAPGVVLQSCVSAASLWLCIQL